MAKKRARTDDDPALDLKLVCSDKKAVLVSSGVLCGASRSQAIREIFGKTLDEAESSQAKLKVPESSATWKVGLAILLHACTIHPIQLDGLPHVDDHMHIACSQYVKAVYHGGSSIHRTCLQHHATVVSMAPCHCSSCQLLLSASVEVRA